MAIDWFTSPSPSHYDTPGTFDKNLRVCHSRRRTVDSVLKVKLVLPSAQHMPKQVKKKLHTPKVKHTQTKQSERREIVINRNVQCSYTQSIYTTEHQKRQLKQRHHHLLARSNRLIYCRAASARTWAAETSHSPILSWPLNQARPA